MKAPEFDYAAPDSLEQALALLENDEDAKVIAGGQSLVALLNMRLTYPSLLVDLRRIPGLTEVREDGETLRIGAMTRQRAAETSSLVAERCPLVVDALRHVAHPQIRSRGTVGGSIVHADPAGELPTLALALDATMVLASSAGTREVPAAEFFQGFLMTATEPAEILVDVIVPAIRPRTGTACVEIARRHGDFAMCGALGQVTVGSDGRVEEARLAFLGVSDRPVRATAVEQAVVGTDGGEAALSAAAELAVDGWEPMDDPQMTAEYRAQIARVVARRALAQAIERTR